MSRFGGCSVFGDKGWCHRPMAERGTETTPPESGTEPKYLWTFWPFTDRMDEQWIDDKGHIVLHVERDDDVMRIVIDPRGDKPRIVESKVLPMGSGEEI